MTNLVFPKPRIAIVVGGGGLKPFAAIPLFRYLEDQKISIDLLVGCSGGSIVAALHACGYTPDDVYERIIPQVGKKLFRPNYRAWLGLGHLPFGRLNRTSALFKAQPLYKFARKWFGETRLENLKIKTVFQATDFQTGEGVGLEQGDLVSALFASSAIYPFLPPVHMDGRWLFDGVYSAPVPILQAVKRNPEIIIVLDFLEKLQENPEGPLESMLHVSKIYAKTIIGYQNFLSVDLLDAEILWMKVKFDHYLSIWESEKFPLILEAGQKALENIKGELTLLINRMNHSRG